MKTRLVLYGSSQKLLRGSAMQRLTFAVLMGFLVLVGSCTELVAEELKLDSLITSAGLTLWNFKKMPPPFELPDMSGKVWRTSDFRGKVVILFMFAEW